MWTKLRRWKGHLVRKQEKKLMIFNFNLDGNEMDLYVMINLFGDVIFDIDAMHSYGVV